MSVAKLSLIGITLLLCTAMNLADPFMASKWSVKVVPDEPTRKAGEKDFQDTLSFTGNTFSSAALAAKGFKPAPFDEDVRPLGLAKFACQQTSDSQGTAKWAGMLTSPTLSGTLVWTKKDGTTLNFAFNGERAEH